MSKGRERRREGAPGDDASVFFGGVNGVNGRRADRKEQQLCRQVREAIGEALSTLDDDVLSDVWISEVLP